MRKIFTLSLLLTATAASARQISPDEAKNAAYAFLNSKSLVPIEAAMPLTRSDAQPYYVFNAADDNGFVIISGDDRFSKVLGYSDRGSFDKSKMPPQLKAMLDNFAEKVNKGASLSDAIHPSWTSAKFATRADEGVLLETAEWGQNAPFNAETPMFGDKHAPTGCVATAMAITMQYHQWPDYTRGGEAVDFYLPDQKFNFDNYTIDWEILNDKENLKFNEEAAKLLYSAGIAAHMSYGANESGAEVWPVSHKLIQYYTYSKECEYIERDMFSEEEWRTILFKQLEEVGPVIYCGSGSGAHCFVIDGYDNEGSYHVNWGWDGYMNGYYTLDFSVDGGMHFEEGQGMIINIKPDKERKEWSQAWVPNVAAYIPGIDYDGGWNFETVDIKPNVPTKYKMPVVSLNGLKGIMAIAVVDENDQILKIIDESGRSIDGTPLYCPYPGMAYWDGTLSFPPLEKGERYQIVAQKPNLAIEDDSISLNPQDYLIVLGGSIRPSYFYETGNNSEVAEISIIFDDKLPFVNLGLPYQNEYKYRELKGSVCGSSMKTPKEGVKFEAKFWDKDDNEIPPVYVAYYMDFADLYGTTISVFANRIEGHYTYEPSKDTRKDSGIDNNEILEVNGLIYHKVNENDVILIGYENPDDEIIITDVVKYGEKEYQLIKIGREALLHAPIKHLVLSTKELKFIDDFAFAGIETLESVTLEDFEAGPIIRNNTAAWEQTMLRKSSFKNIYLDAPLSWWSHNFIFSVNNNNGLCEYRNPDLYLSYIPESHRADSYLQNHFIDMETFHENANGAPFIHSYYVPGTVKNILAEYSGIPLIEMWSFDIDKEAGLVKIDSIADNIEIETVRINENATEKNEAGFYEFPITKSSLPDIEITYTVNGHREMRSKYNSSYLEELPSTQLSWSVGGNFNNWNINTNIQMTQQPDGTFKTTIPSLQGLFKITSGEDWDGNIGALNYPDITGNCKVTGIRNGVPFNAPNELVNVTISFDPATLMVEFSGLANDTDVTKPYIKAEGCFILGYQSQLVPNAGVEMAEVEDGIFQSTVNLNEDSKIMFSTALIGLPDTDDGKEKAWEEMRNHIISPAGISSNQTSFSLPANGSVSLTFPGTNDVVWAPTTPGRYKITIDIAKKTMTVEAAAIPLYIMGEVESLDGVRNNFMEPSLNNEAIYNSQFRLEEKEAGLYTGSFFISPSGFGDSDDPNDWPKFRLYTELLGWSNEAVLGSSFSEFDYLPTEFGKEYSIVKGGPGYWAINVKEKTLIDISVDLENLIIRIDSDNSGIKFINNGEDIREQWYDLQGVRVTNPRKGIFIRVKGNKAEKVVL